MIVVADTSPLTALLKINEEALLPKLFRDVVIPGAVRDELLRTHAILPNWLQAIELRDRRTAELYMLSVDAGEAEAIALARELEASRLLIDERKGRRLAEREGILVTGVVGVLILAKRHKLIPAVRPLLDRLLIDAGVYVSADVRNAALSAASE